MKIALEFTTDTRILETGRDYVVMYRDAYPGKNQLVGGVWMGEKFKYPCGRFLDQSLEPDFINSGSYNRIVGFSSLIKWGEDNGRD